MLGSTRSGSAAYACDETGCLAAGGGIEDVVFNAIFIKNLDDYQEMNEVYREYFPTDPPARYSIRSDLVKPGFLVEIASTAHLA